MCTVAVNNNMTGNSLHAKISLCSPSSLEGPRFEVVPGLFCVHEYQGAPVDGNGLSVLVALQRSEMRLPHLRPSESESCLGLLPQQIAKLGRNKLIVRSAAWPAAPHITPACASFIPKCTCI